RTFVQEFGDGWRKPVLSPDAANRGGYNLRRNLLSRDQQQCPIDIDIDTRRLYLRKSVEHDRKQERKRLFVVFRFERAAQLIVPSVQHFPRRQSLMAGKGSFSDCLGVA